MKLNKTKTSVNAEFTDSCEGTTKTDVHVISSVNSCWVDLVYQGQSVTGRFDKPELEQLIYVLTLARNRMK